jgi:Flp pilus assembly protein TadD
MKRSLASSLLAGVVLLALVQHHSVTSARYLDRSIVPSESVDDSARVDADATPNASADKEKKGGNGFVRAISAPFRAIGRLFGGGKKKDQGISRISDNDAKKFGTTLATRIKDSESQTPEPPASSNEQLPAAEVSAKRATANQQAVVSAVNVSISKARTAINVGDFETAIAELARAASLDSHNAEVQNLLGVAFESRGMRQRALDSFEKAVHLSKDNAQYLNNYGFLLYLNGDLEDATKYLKRAAKLAPNDARIWNNLGLTQSKREKFDDAYASFVRAVGEYNGHINIAAQLQQHGKAKDAIEHLEKAQAMRPNSVDVLSKLVGLYEMTGRHTDAETARRSFVALKTFADANK